MPRRRDRTAEERTLARRLRALRRQRRYTQEHVAGRAGVAPNAVSFYESGKRIPTLRVVCALATVLDCSVDYLVGRAFDPR